MKPPTILIVEDDAGARAGLTMAIEAAGFAVRELSNGRDALAFLRMTRIAPSAILIDLTRPSLGGWSFLRERLKHIRLLAIPVIVVSSDPELHEAARLGAVAVIEKPFRASSVVRILKIIVGFGAGAG
jgi:CheY-like chemotaxis protein